MKDEGKKMVVFKLKYWCWERWST